MQSISQSNLKNLILFSNHRLSTKHGFPNQSVASLNNLYYDMCGSYTTMTK